jgi:hypothetical protein
MIIDLSGLQTYFTISLTITVACSVVALFQVLRIRDQIKDLTYDIETLTTKTLDLTKKLGSAEGQMQGRDWALQQTDVISVANVKALVEKATELTK